MPSLFTFVADVLFGQTLGQVIGMEYFWLKEGWIRVRWYGVMQCGEGGVHMDDQFDVL